MTRPCEPFRADILLRPEDITCEALRELIKKAGLTEREAQVWLTHQISQIAPYAAGTANTRPLTQSAIAGLLGCSKQYVNYLFLSARRKIAKLTGGYGYVLAERGEACPVEYPTDPDILTLKQRQAQAGEIVGV